METPSNSLSPCVQFAFIAELEDERFSDCSVCGRLEISHDRTGRRGISVEQAKDERLALIDADYRSRLSP